MYHENFAACPNQEVLHLLVVPEIHHAAGTYQNGLNLLFADNLGQVVIYAVNPEVQQFHVPDAGFVRDETADIKADRTLRTDVFGQAHAAGKSAVHQCAHGVGIGIGNVEHQLDHNPESPHGQGGQQERKQDIAWAEKGQVRYFLPLEQQAAEQGKSQVHGIGIHHLQKVHETGVAQNSGIGFENTETRPA